MNDLKEEHWHDPEGDPRALGTVRDLIRTSLAEWGLGDLADDVILAIDELCTNAIIHGKPPIDVVLRVNGNCLAGEVSDQAPLFIPPPRVSDESLNGRGLHIVDGLVDKWGIDPTESGGKVVWTMWLNR